MKKNKPNRKKGFFASLFSDIPLKLLSFLLGILTLLVLLY